MLTPTGVCGRPRIHVWHIQPEELINQYVPHKEVLGKLIMPSIVDHPIHYGGGDNPHEHVKCAEAWGLVDTPKVGAWLYNATKYICRAGKKDDILTDLKKAAWYLNRAIERLERSK